MHFVKHHAITLTSQWPRWCLKSPASRLFTQSFIRAQIKENIKAPHHWPLCGEFTRTGEFPAQRASNAENVSIWWRHHAVTHPARVTQGCVSKLDHHWSRYWNLKRTADWIFVQQLAQTNYKENIKPLPYSGLILSLAGCKPRISLVTGPL